MNIVSFLMGTRQTALIRGGEYAYHLLKSLGIKQGEAVLHFVVDEARMTGTYSDFDAGIEAYLRLVRATTKGGEAPTKSSV